MMDKVTVGSSEDMLDKAVEKLLIVFQNHS
jgi:hypothetical protein